MRRRVPFILGAIVLLMAIAFTSCQQAVSTTTSDKVQTVLANAKGRIVDSNGAGIKGITLTFDTPNGVDMSTTTSKAITSVTTDAAGRFSLDGLASGDYTAFAAPTTTTTGTTTTVDYMGKMLWIHVPTNAEITAGSGTGVTGGSLGGNLNGNGYYTVQMGDTTLPILGAGGSIKATIVQIPAGTTSPTTAPLPVATKKVVMQFKNSLYYPTYDATAKAITYSTFITATTDANGVVTFSGLPFMNYGDGTDGTYPSYPSTTPIGTEPGSYGNGLLVELNPGVQITSASIGTKRVYLPFIRLGSLGLAKDVVVTDTLPLSAAVTYPNLALVSTSTKDSYGNTNNVAVNAAVVLTFNNTLANSFSGDDVILDGSGNLVPATVTIAGKTITITPAANLKNSATFYVFYKASDGNTPVIDRSASTLLGGGGSLSSGITFTTVNSAVALVAPTDLAIDTSLGKPSTFNSGTTSFQVTYTYNSAYTYIAIYKVKTAAGVQGDWVMPSGGGSGASLTVSKYSSAGTTAYSTIAAISGWSSGDTLTLALLVQSNVTGSNWVQSNALTITDTVAPTFLQIARNSSFSLGQQAISGGTTPLTATVASAPTFTAPTATADSYTQLYVSIGGEVLNTSTFTVAVTTTTPKIAIDSVQFPTSVPATYAIINIKILKGATPLATLSGSGETIRITGVADGAGNALVDSAAATVVTTTLTF